MTLQPFNKGYETPLEFPLTSIPDNTRSRLVSPKVGKQHGIENPFTNENIEDYYNEVQEARNMVANNIFPHELFKKYYPKSWGEYPSMLPQPLINEGLSFDMVGRLADVVHMDSPVDSGIATLDYVLSVGSKPKTRDTHHVDFLNVVPDAIASIANHVKFAMHKTFEVKYYYGVGRPEEMYNKDKNPYYNQYITAYPEGCPCHPSFPAGHGGASGACAVAIINHFDLDLDVLKVVKDTAYFWAMFRTLAGVHYAPDNIAGLAVSGLVSAGEFNTFYWND